MAKSSSVQVVFFYKDVFEDAPAKDIVAHSFGNASEVKVLEQKVENVQDITQFLQGQVEKTYGFIPDEFKDTLQNHLGPISVFDQQIGACDLVVKEGGIIKTHSLLKKAILKLFENYKSPVAILQKASLIVGVNGDASMALSALLQMGISQFLICDQDHQKAQDFITRCHRNFLGSTFKFVSPEDLVLLPGSSGVVINSLRGTEELFSVYELRYFNFLARGGILINSRPCQLSTRLAQDATSFGYEVFADKQIWDMKIAIASGL